MLCVTGDIPRTHTHTHKSIAQPPTCPFLFFSLVSSNYPMLHSKDKVRPPRNLRSARRSLVKNKISTPTHAPANVLSTPKKIIKALYDYQAQGPHELSFSRGDFFHVTNRENDTHWFEACNPATSSKGLVPVSYFQVLDKSERTLTVAGPNRAADSDFMDPMNGHYAIGKDTECMNDFLSHHGCCHRRP